MDPSRSRSCATTLVLVRGDTQTNRGRSFLPMLAQETAALRDLGLANVRFGAKSSRSVTTEPCPLYPRKRTKSRHVGTSALCQKRTYAVQQNVLMMFQRRLSCVGRLAATASFGASTILGSRIVKVEPRPAHIQVHACYEGDIFRVEVI